MRRATTAALSERGYIAAAPSGPLGWFCANPLPGPGEPPEDCVYGSDHAEGTARAEETNRQDRCNDRSFREGREDGIIVCLEQEDEGTSPCRTVCKENRRA